MQNNLLGKIFQGISDYFLQITNDLASSTFKIILHEGHNVKKYLFTFFVKTIKPAFFSMVFVAFGVIIFLIGGSQFIDSIVQIPGAGLMSCGIILLLLGIYYGKNAEISYNKDLRDMIK